MMRSFEFHSASCLLPPTFAKASAGRPASWGLSPQP